MVSEEKMMYRKRECEKKRGTGYFRLSRTPHTTQVYSYASGDRKHATLQAQVPTLRNFNCRFYEHVI